MIGLLREWPLIVGCCLFAAINVSLWASPLTQTMLCAAAAFLGLIFFTGMMLHVSREGPRNKKCSRSESSPAP